MKYSRFVLRRAWVFGLAVAAMTFALSGRSTQAELVFSDVFTGTNVKIQASNAVDLAGTSLQAVTLRAVGLNGALANTFDSDKSGAHGTGITASALHQVWYGGAIPTPTMDNMSLIDPLDSQDSHFLVLTGNLASAAAPSEDYSSAGYGTYLKGTFTDLTAVGTSWDFAYLVVPKATTVTLDFEIAGVDSNQAGIAETVIGSFVVPEPNTLLLLTMGVVFGLIAYRKRLVG